MAKQNDIPRRTAQPESITYLLIDKKSFQEMLANFVAAIEGQVGNKQDVSIHVDGFDGAFESAEDVVNTLTAKEWANLSGIRVYISDKDQYANRLSLNFGGYSFKREGLRIEYGKGNTDIERLAIKEKIDLFMDDYKRTIWLNDRALGTVASFLVSSGFLMWLYTSLSDSDLEKLTLWNHINVFSFALFFGGCAFVLTSYAHHKIVPHFEIVKDKNQTRLKKTTKIILAFAFIVGLSSGLLALLQWLF